VGRPEQAGVAITTLSAPASTLGRVRQTYARKESFPPITQAYTKVSQVVRETGLLERTPWFYIAVASAIVVGFAGAITGFILLGDSWFQLLIAAALGILFTQVAFLSHEAAHRTILKSGRANDTLGLIIGNGIVGMSRDWWGSKHTRHHANPNRVSKDPDIEVDTIRFLEVDAEKVSGPMSLITRRQGWLFFPLLTLEGLNLHWLALRHVFNFRHEVKDRWLEIGLLAMRWTLVLVPVFVFLPLGMAFAFLGVQMAVFGIYMGAAFAPNHKGMPIIDADAKLDFFTKQVRTSRNISGGWWATWLMGGLNYQIEHHLFPSMPRPHLAQAREIVKDYCATLGVPYTETTLIKSYGIVIRYLNEVGLAARDPFECGIVAKFRNKGSLTS
jgi:fatty acid desaturase